MADLLLVVSRDGTPEQVVPVARYPFTVGTSPACDLVLDAGPPREVLGSLELSRRGVPEFWFTGEDRWVRMRPGAAVDLPPYVLVAVHGSGARGPSGSDPLAGALGLARELWALENPDEAPALLLETLREVLGAEWGAVLRPGERGEPPAVLATSGARATQEGEGVSRTLLRLLEDAPGRVLRTEVAAAPALEAAGSVPAELRALIACELRHDGVAEGVLYLENPAAVRRFTVAEERLLGDLVDFAGETLARARTQRELGAARARLGALHRLDRDRERDPRRIVGASPALRDLLAEVARVGPTAVTALVVGETGTGKELIARALHEASPRREGPFVAVNCAALPPGLVESELFGHAPGAFSGSTGERLGRIELAHGGTLFLDELVELPAAAQASLLRALEERAVVRVGEGHPRPVDFRLVAASGEDPAARVEAGDFRADLYHRVAVYRLELPPLRARREDIPALVEHFVSEFAPRHRRAVRGATRKALRLLDGHPWPGNVRELRNAVEQAVVRAEGAWLHPEHFSLLPPPVAGDGPRDLATARLLWERTFLREALEEARGQVAAAARRLGVSRQSLYEKCRILELDPGDFRS